LIFFTQRQEKNVAEKRMSLIIDFPNPRFSEDVEGVICVSETEFLNPENLLHAYRHGIFPWMVEDYPYVPWFSPPERAVLEFDELHVPRSLRKVRDRCGFTFTIDRSFVRVMMNCARVKRKGQYGTWITQEVFDSYTRLHALDRAHSVEVWDEEGNLVGGLYGVDAGGVFCGESMFHFHANASKLALLFLVEHLKARGATWLDVQVMTPHMKILGAKEIPREDFLDKLQTTLAENIRLF
jgi:leucyl/phenylalanyl-tRNA---protein transferase